MALISLIDLRGGGVPFPSALATFVAVIMLAGLTGCGQSEQAVDRKAGRQQFKEAVAAIQVRTKGSTYSEFRQTELAIKTSYQINKPYLEDVATKVEKLEELLSGTDHFWSRTVKYPDSSVYPGDKTELYYAQILDPATRLAEKVNYTLDQREKDPEFLAENYVRKGLKSVADVSREIMDSLHSHK